MGKFACECGNILSDTSMPCEAMNFLVTSSVAFDSPEQLESDLENFPELWECPECKGLTRFDGEAHRTCYYKRIDG